MFEQLYKLVLCYTAIENTSLVLYYYNKRRTLQQLSLNLIPMHKPIELRPGHHRSKAHAGVDFSGVAGETRPRPRQPTPHCYHIILFITINNSDWNAVETLGGYMVDSGIAYCSV